MGIYLQCTVNFIKCHDVTFQNIACGHKGGSPKRVWLFARHDQMSWPTKLLFMGSKSAEQ